MDEQMMEQQPEQQQQPEMELSADGVQSQMQIPPEMQQAYERIVLAGLKFMFDPQTHEMALAEIEKGEGPIEQRVALGIVGLMGMLIQQSNSTLPPQLILPSAVTLYMHAMDFMAKSGEPVGKEQVGSGMATMLQELLKNLGIPAEQMAQLFGGGLDQDAALQKAEQQGLIGQAMQGA